VIRKWHRDIGKDTNLDFETITPRKRPNNACQIGKHYLWMELSGSGMCILLPIDVVWTTKRSCPLSMFSVRKNTDRSGLFNNRFDQSIENAKNQRLSKIYGWVEV
jgi:hypothetical protein